MIKIPLVESHNMFNLLFTCIYSSVEKISRGVLLATLTLIGGALSSASYFLFLLAAVAHTVRCQPGTVLHGSGPLLL